jgi:hypothetical protein
MKRPRRKTPVFYALCANAGLLLAILLVMIGRPGFPGSIAMAAGGPPQPIAGGAGLFLMPGQFSTSTWGCYVMDVDAQTLCAYQFFPGGKQLRLVAARSFRFDRQLKNFNTDPSPTDVEKLTELEKAAPRGVTRPTTKPAVPQPEGDANDRSRDGSDVGTE